LKTPQPTPPTPTPPGGIVPRLPAKPAAPAGPSKLPSWAMASTPPAEAPKPIPSIPKPVAKVALAAPKIASSLDQVRVPTPPRGSLKLAVPKPVVSEKSPAQIDLGSELRADLGGDHAVPKKRNSSPKIEVRAPTVEPAPVEEPEIEEVVELEADAPPDDDDDDAVEMTVVEDDGEDTLSNVPALDPDDDNAEMTVIVDDTDEEPATTPSHRAITPTDAVVVSGTIKISDDEAPKPRPKRLSEGWED
jgi:hypothetical protein